MDLLIKIEILNRIDEGVKEPNNDLGVDNHSFNWMKENTPLLKKLDNAMIMTQQPRHFKVASLNIGKDEAYYVMDRDKRIDLEHGDILQIDQQYSVRISLIHEGNRRELNDADRLYSPMNKRQFGMKFNTIVDGSLNNFSRLDRDDLQKNNKNVIQTIHDLVPSKSSFSPPQYRSRTSEKVSEFKNIVKSSAPSTKIHEINHAFSVNEGPMDTMYKNYKESDRSFNNLSEHNENNTNINLYHKIKRLFK